MTVHVKKAKRFLSESQRQALIARYQEACKSGEFLTQAGLGREFGVTQVAAGQILRAAGVKTRGRREANPPTFDIEAAAKLYLSDRSMTEKKVGELFGVSQGVMSTQLRHFGVQIREDADYAQYSECNRRFFSEVTPTTAYFAGFIAADGYIPPSGRSVILGIHPKDRCILEALKSVAMLDQSIVDRTETSGLNKGRTYSWLNVSSVDWVKDLEKHYNIVNKKSLTLLPPNITDESLIWHYIRGYFDGDGHISKTGTAIVLTCGSPRFFDWLLERCGRTPGHVQTHMWETDDREEYVCALSAHYSGSDRERIIEKMYKDSTPEIRLDRKYRRAMRLPAVEDHDPLDEVIDKSQSNSY